MFKGDRVFRKEEGSPTTRHCLTEPKLNKIGQKHRLALLPLPLMDAKEEVSGLPQRQTGFAEGDCEIIPRQYKTAPQQCKTTPQHYKTAPQHLRTAPRQYETATRQYRTAPRQGKTTPQHYETAPQRYETALQHFRTGFGGYEREKGWLNAGSGEWVPAPRSADPSPPGRRRGSAP